MTRRRCDARAGVSVNASTGEFVTVVCLERVARTVTRRGVVVERVVAENGAPLPPTDVVDIL